MEVGSGRRRLAPTPHTVWDLPDDRADEAAAKADREIRLTDFLLFFAVPFAGVAVSSGRVPLNELAMIVLLAFCALRTPPTSLRLPTWAPIGIVLMFGTLTLSAFLNDVTAERRLVHVVLYLGVVLALATGRVSLPSASAGMGTALVVVSGLGYIGLSTSAYTDRLTGYFSDPNVAAFYLTTLGAVSIAHLPWPRLRWILVLLFAAGVLLTLSRTGLLAASFGLIWILVGRRLGVFGGAALVSFLVWLVGNLPDQLRLFGPFSDRTGSDALRERVINAELDLLRSAPIYGHGPGTSQVNVADQTFFFHSSYLATRNEGGWILLTVMLGLLAAAFVGLVTYGRRNDVRAVWCQVALLTTLAMAVTLGEVFLEMPTAIALGYAIRTRLMLQREDGVP
ncbi:MAG: O-antigen ligase family protein [Nocardioides sp.]